MVDLQLTDEEAKQLEAGLGRLLVELEREIARTDSREYRKDLERTEEVLRTVTDQLRQAA
jgi:hypothetical protein